MVQVTLKGTIWLIICGFTGPDTVMGTEWEGYASYALFVPDGKRAPQVVIISNHQVVKIGEVAGIDIPKNYPRDMSYRKQGTPVPVVIEGEFIDGMFSVCKVTRRPAKRR